jgi:hypothetical protein
MAGKGFYRYEANLLVHTFGNVRDACYRKKHSDAHSLLCETNKADLCAESGLCSLEELQTCTIVLGPHLRSHTWAASR